VCLGPFESTEPTLRERRDGASWKRLVQARRSGHPSHPRTKIGRSSTTRQSKITGAREPIEAAISVVGRYLTAGCFWMQSSAE
jgi:hypothetical protein